MGWVRDERRKRRIKKLAYFTIETTSDPVFWIDSEARIYRVNEAACRSLVYSRDELLSMKVYDIDPDFQAENWPKHWAEVKERKSLTFETRHRTKDGHIFSVEVTGNFIQFEGKEILVQALCFDICPIRNLSSQFYIQLSDKNYQNSRYCILLYSKSCGKIVGQDATEIERICQEKQNQIKSCSQFRRRQFC